MHETMFMIKTVFWAQNNSLFTKQVQALACGWEGATACASLTLPHPGKGVLGFVLHPHHHVRHAEALLVGSWGGQGGSTLYEGWVAHLREGGPVRSHYSWTGCGGEGGERGEGGEEGNVWENRRSGIGQNENMERMNCEGRSLGLHSIL